MRIIGYNGSHRPTRTPQQSRAGDYGPGIYFASEVEDAREYGPYVYEAIVTVENPLVVGPELTADMDKIRAVLRIDEENLEYADPGEPLWHVIVEYAKLLMDTSPLTQEGFQNVIRNYGYDSIYVPNSSITFYPHGAHIQGDYIIAFDESQVSDWQRVDAD